MTTRRRVLTSLLALCAAPAAARSPEPLTVSAASSLTDVLRDLGRRFEQSHDNVTVRLNFGASGALLQQIANGAPVDVFISADEETVERGIARDLLAGATRRDVAANRLVLVTPRGVQRLNGIGGLADPAIRRIAIGKAATVPAGRYARQALERAGLWQGLETRLVYAEHVRQVLDYVSRGEVDAGLVYATDAALMHDRVRVAATVDGHAPIRYPAVVVEGTRRRSLAAGFIEFLRSPEARDRLAAYGFNPPGR